MVGGGQPPAVAGPTDIAIGSSGAVFVIGGTRRGVDNALYSWSGSGWVVHPGQGMRVAVEASGTPWLMNAAGVPWRQDAGVAGGWRQMPGKIRDIAAGASMVWSIDNGAQVDMVQHWTGSTWGGTNCGGAKLAVSGDGYPWVITSSGGVLQVSLTPVQNPPLKP